MLRYVIQRTFEVGQDRMPEVGRRSRQIIEDEFPDVAPQVLILLAEQPQSSGSSRSAGPVNSTRSTNSTETTFRSSPATPAWVIAVPQD